MVTVQRALGHSSATITLGVYSHLWPTAEDRTRAAAGGLMAAAFNIFYVFGALDYATVFAGAKDRLPINGEGAVFITLMLPVEVRIYPTYKIAADLNLLDTYAGLTLPLVASATATLLFRQFFMTVPEELVEASRIDGAGPLRFFKDTLLPLSRTTVAALFVILFIYGWNQYLWPLLVLNDLESKTLAVGMQFFASNSESGQLWGPMMATAALATLPPLLIYAVAQKHIISTFVTSGVKG